MRRPFRVVLVLVLFAMPGCDGEADAGGRTEIVVFAAASLAPAFARLGDGFETANPGARVTFNFGPSDGLAEQIASEGTADVFASASQRWMDEVEASVGALHRFDFARNSLVVITPAANPAGIRTLEDLAAPGIQVVLAAEGVPAGDYAREALADAGALEAVLANVVSNEEDVAAVVARVEAGEADAGIAYASDSSPAAGRDVLAIPIPGDVVATYPIAMIAGTQRPELARAFVHHVISAEGLATLERFGFLPPP